MIKALLFDLYDTLAHIDANLYLKVKAAMAAKAGLPLDKFLEVWKSYTSVCSSGAILTIEERVARVIRALKSSSAPQVIRDMALLECKLQTEDVHLAGNEAEMLEYFQKKGLRLGLVTNAPSYMRDVPRLLGIDRYFETIVFSCDLRLLKPDPLIYLAACRNLAVEPNECIFIGDGNDRELDGAKELGMITVKIGKGRNKKLQGELSRTWDYRISRIDELKEFVEKVRIVS